MSLTALRPYFRARAKTMGWSEWKNVFDADNIPSTLIDGSYHIQFRATSGTKTNQVDSEISVPVEVKYFKKGFASIAEGLDAAVKSAENFIKECLKGSNRLSQPGIKNVAVQSVDFSQFGKNSNLVMVTMIFSCLVVIDTN